MSLESLKNLDSLLKARPTKYISRERKGNRWVYKYADDKSASKQQNAGDQSAPKKQNADIDQSMARELGLFIANDYSLYEKAQAIMLNLQRKHRSKTYDASLAPQAFMHLVNEGLKKYAKKEAGTNNWSSLANVATRRKVAEELAKQHRAEMEIGNYHMDPKSSVVTQAEKDAVRKVGADLFHVDNMHLSAVKGGVRRLTPEVKRKVDLALDRDFNHLNDKQREELYAVALHGFENAWSPQLHAQRKGSSVTKADSTSLQNLDVLLKSCAAPLVAVKKQVVREGKPYYKEVCEYPEGKGDRFEKHPKEMSNEELSRIVNAHGDTKDPERKKLVDAVVDEWKKRRATMNKAIAMLRAARWLP